MAAEVQHFGKHQRALCQQAGFINVQTSATYECYGTEQTARNWGEVIAETLCESKMIKDLGELGIEHAEIEGMRTTWMEWGDNPAAFFADSYCEAIGWKA